MSNPKGQHYIPQCYLGEWVDPNTPVGQEPYVWMFDKNGKNRKKKAPKNILKGKDLYTLDVGDYSIEKTLAKLEGDYTKIFRTKIKKKLPLSEYEHIILCAFVSTMLQRTLRYKDNLEKFYDELIERTEMMEKHHNVEAKKSKELREFKKHTHKTGVIQLLPDITELLLKMNIAFFCVDNSDSKFVTSDDPCNLFNPDLQWQKFYSPGLAQKNVQITLPLSPDIVLCMSWSNLCGYIKWEKSQVEEANRMTVGRCYKYFVSRRPKVKRIWLRKYPMDFFFILKIFRHKISMWAYKLKTWYRLRNVRRK